MPEPNSSAPTGLARLRGLLANPLSLIGLALAAVAFGNILFLFFLDLASNHPNPYVGILAYMVAPAFLALGLMVAVFGAVYTRRKRLSSTGASPYLRFDFSDPSQRGAVALFLAFVVVFIGISVVGSYKAYTYTDSVSFCGQVCHSVMSPEFTAYQHSPHAHVACVDCHVGAGATWYVKAKLSGVRRVYKLATDTYARPIPSPVQDLRPARDTCEACHWPKKFYGRQLKVFNHFASDEKNTPSQIRLLINVGGGDPATGESEGIHWHMNIANQITYLATDEQRQNIAYIHVRDLQGRVTEYFAKDSKLTKEQIAGSPKRLMDCTDCHNRPTHIFVPPDTSVDRALAAHRLDISLPFIKQQSVAALTGSYTDTSAAMQGIAKTISEFYNNKYPDLAKTKESEIRNAIDELQNVYKGNFFPEMKTDWRAHPNNIGHFYFNGCFRCHDGQHVSAEGKVISKECDTCHTVLSEQQNEVKLEPLPAVQFKHPIDLGDLTAVSCSDCHTGGVSP
ncbi:MAG: NapC/NirT family cytochrome c [Terriglobales bacterium]